MNLHTSRAFTVLVYAKQIWPSRSGAYSVLHTPNIEIPRTAKAYDFALQLCTGVVARCVMKGAGVGSRGFAAALENNETSEAETDTSSSGHGTPLAIGRAISGVLPREDAGVEFNGSIDLSVVGAPMAVCAKDGQLLGVSPAGRALLERAGQTIHQLPTPLIGNLWNVCKRLEAGQSFHVQAHFDELITVSCTVQPLGRDQLLLLLEEISSKQHALSSRLHQQRLELTGRLVAMIAHDLRVPLATILFNAEMAQADRPTREVSVALRDIRSSADRMRASINGLLDFARPGGSRCSMVDLGTVFGRLRSLLHPSLREGRHELHYVIENRAVWVHTNALLLEHVLVNLVMNAVEASDKPVDIRIHATTATANTDTSSGLGHCGAPHVAIRVEDNGPGIPIGIAERIFEPFFTTKKSGAGLGLPMAREAMAAIGASLNLDESSRGARFVLRLPAAAEGNPL